MSYTCPRCGRTSEHPEDEKNQYCGACHLFEQFEREWSPYCDRLGNPISREEGARLLESSDRRIAHDILGAGNIITTVSTVFLVINHQWRAGPPMIFETMIFSTDPGIDDYTWRYSTEEQAAAGHRRVVAWLKGEGPHPDDVDDPADTSA